MRSPSRPDQAAPVAPDPIPPVSDMVQVPLCIDDVEGLVEIAGDTRRHHIGPGEWRRVKDVAVEGGRL